MAILDMQGMDNASRGNRDDSATSLIVCQSIPSLVLCG
jgi:SapB morphogen precursor RamS